MIELFVTCVRIIRIRQYFQKIWEVFLMRRAKFKDCKTVVFFLEIGKRLSSVSLLFSASFQTFGWLFARTYIRKNTDCFAVYQIYDGFYGEFRYTETVAFSLTKLAEINLSTSSMSPFFPPFLFFLPWTAFVFSSFKKKFKRSFLGVETQSELGQVKKWFQGRGWR